MNMIDFAQILPKKVLKGTMFFNLQLRPKNGKMANPFYFWQKVSKKAMEEEKVGGVLTKKNLFRLD